MPELTPEQQLRLEALSRAAYDAGDADNATDTVARATEYLKFLKGE